MNYNKLNGQIGSEIQRKLAESLSQKLDVPVYVINSDLVKSLFEHVKELPDIDKKYSSDELYQEVSGFVRMYLVSKPNNDKEITKFVKSFIHSLENEKEYESIIILPGIIDLPIGTKIGPIEIIDHNENDVQLEKYLKFLHDNKNFFSQNRSRCRVRFKSYSNIKVRDVLYKILEMPLSILALLTNFDLDVRDCAGLIRSSENSIVHYLEPQNETRGWSKFRIHDKSIVNNLSILSKISLNQKPSKLEIKIFNAIRIFGLSRLSYKPEIRFLMIISSFESLLLTENDRDYLGKKLCEKIAFLIENELEKRLKLYRQMKKYYKKRSDLVHMGKTTIKEIDVKNIESIFRKTVFKTLELSLEYTKMEQKSNEKDKEGIEDFINRIRFS